MNKISSGVTISYTECRDRTRSCLYFMRFVGTPTLRLISDQLRPSVVSLLPFATAWIAASLPVVFYAGLFGCSGSGLVRSFMDSTRAIVKD